MFRFRFGGGRKKDLGLVVEKNFEKEKNNVCVRKKRKIKKKYLYIWNK